MIEPVDLSDALQRYCPIEYLCSVMYVALTVFAQDAPWPLRIAGIPLMVWNLKRTSAKDHKLYFITKQEYGANFARMERQYQIKTCYYTLLFVMSLVMSILAAINFFEI